MSVLEWSTGPGKDTLVDQSVSQNLSGALTTPDRLFWVDRCVGQTIREDQALLFLLSEWTMQPVLSPRINTAWLSAATAKEDFIRGAIE